jgi:hypothetical protein
MLPMGFARLLTLLLIFAGTAAHADDEASCLAHCSAGAHDVFGRCRTQGGALDDCLDAATDASRRCTATCPSAMPRDERCDALANDVVRQCMDQIADASACAQLRQSARDRCAYELADSGSATRDVGAPATWPGN